MRKNYKPQKLLKTVFILLFSGMLSSAFAQLSGTYTIDNTTATGGTNFQTWIDFRNNLVSVGLSGPVTVNVLTDNTESAQIDFPVIATLTSTNNLKINGNGKFLSMAVSDAVFRFSGADYITIDNLIIRNTSTSQYTQGVRFYNASDYNTIKNCTIEFTSMATGTTAGGAYVAFSGSATSMTSTSSTGHGIFNLIDNNLMRTTNTNSPGPTYGITCTGSTSTYTSTAQNNTISNNRIQNFYYMGIYMYYTNGNQVLNNDISRTNATSYNCYSIVYGVYSYYSYAANRSTKLESNFIHDLPFTGATVSSAPSTVYGMMCTYNYGNANYRFSVSNNTLQKIRASVTLYNMYSQYSYFLDMIGNLINDNDVTQTSSSSYNFYGIYTYYNYNSYRINSNTIQNSDGGYYWYGIYNYYPVTSSGVTEINDNTIQNNSTGYQYSYLMYNYYAQYSNATYPMDIMRNTVKNNIAPSTTTNYTYIAYWMYYGQYRVWDNIFDNNTSNYYNYGLYIQYYMNIDMQRNTIINNKGGISANQGYCYGMYIYSPYNLYMAHNLIANNVGYYTTYTYYIYQGTTANYQADIVQNTFIGKGSNYGSHYFYNYFLLYYNTLVRYYGNIFDFQNSYGLYNYFYNYTQQQFNSNSYYQNAVTNATWATTSSGSSNSATGWVSLNLGTNEVAVVGGHNFATNYASNRFVNQNNVPNLFPGGKDLYKVNRNPSASDRGAVEGMLDIAQIANNFTPTTPTCAGFAPTPTLTFQNNFAEPVTGFTVACSDNGVIKATVKFTNTIPINGTGTVTFPPIVFSQSGAHKVKFFLLAADDLPANDTMTFNFNVLKAPGGSIPTFNSILSSTAAVYKTDGKPDLTFPNEKMVYDLGSPSTLGYTNADYGTKWIGTVSAKTINGFNANSTVSGNNGVPFKATLDAPKAWEDSTIEMSIRIIDLATGCDTIYKRKILIAPKAVPDAKLPTALCEKNDIIFESTSTVSSGSIDYEWDFGDGSPKSNEASPAHRYANFGQYTVTLKTTTNPHGFTTSKTFLIDVTEVPNAGIINTNACEGTSVKLKNSTVYGGSGSVTYSWDYGDGSSVFTTTSSADHFKNYSTPGGYKVTLTASAAGCSNSITKVVYQFAKPTADFVQKTGMCLNNVFSFENKSTISQGQFGTLWDFDDAGNKATVKNPDYNFLTAGVKNVKLDVTSEFGCVASKTIQIIVKQTPTTDFSYPFACSRTATPFTNTTNLNGETLNSYFWNFGDGFTSSANSPLKNWTTIGPRVVSLTTYLQNGCSTTESKIVNVGVQPSVNFNVEDRCAGSEVPFTNLTSYPQGTISYEWNFGDGNKSTKAAPVHAYGSGVSQTYTVQLKAGILGGCADSISKTVTINPLPTTCDFSITGNFNAAKTSALTFTPTGGSTSGNNYTWITGDGNSVNSSNTGTNYTYQAPGKYCVTMTATNAAGCQCSTTKCVTMSLDITDATSMNNAVSVYPNPNSGVFNVSLSAEITGVMTVNVYNTLGELVKTVTVDGNSTSVDMSEFASGVYTVKVMAENQVATKKVTITK